MPLKTIQTPKETIRIGDWTIRPKSLKGRWKVSGPSGNFTLHQIGTTQWRFIYGRSSDRSQRRQQIDAVGVEEAALVSITALFGKSATTITTRLDIADVLRHGWEDSNAEPHHKKNLNRFTGYFLDWCLGQTIYYWEILLEKKSPKDYVTYLAERGLQRKSIGHYLEPLKRASQWAAAKSHGQLEDWFAGFKIPPKTGVELKYDNQKPLAYLPISTLLNLLNWLRDYRQGLSLRPGIALQGLAALQLQEALRITWDKWDRVNRTITIEEDRRRDPKTAGVKNRWRVRRLPIPELVNNILIETYLQRGCPKGSELIVDVRSWKAYCSRMYHMFAAWSPKAQIPPSDLRNTIATVADDQNWMSIWVRRYYGHAPANVLECHYLAQQAAAGVEEGTDQFVEKLRREVVVHIDAAIQAAVADSRNAATDMKPTVAT